ncbi:class I SAM-dependent methyltransferase [Pseudonocardia nigra]|uniref:class I SAM-dependent methyltransferase n=1 Tax=Pseudonocardia nigra TaxID=1921578 RepID=UPI0027E29047|nr:class I SAM-dependent methyltransferase [Pseudonocardia nigra]
MRTYVHPSNAETAGNWDGPGGDFWSDNADMFDAGVARYLQPFLDAAAIGPDLQVLDVGCGAGQTTREAARLAAAGSAVGVDLSTRLLDLARRRAEQEGLTNVRFEQADAQVADLGADRYDRVISRTGVMFFGDPVAAFTNLAGALKPDGRLVLLVWQSLAEQEWFPAFMGAVAAGRDIPPPPADRPGPFSLGDPERVHAVLTAAGFTEPTLVGLREPMFYGPDVATAETFVLGLVGGALADLDDAARAEAMAALRATLEAHLGPEGVTYRSAMWIVTAERAG